VTGALRGTAFGFASLLVLAQAVPLGHDHTTSLAVPVEPAWDRPLTRQLAARACFDCHSDQTAWPWYSDVAPASWLVANDVIGGRRRLNFSEFDRTQRSAGDAAQAVRENSMPPWTFTLVHANARLSPTERDELARGLAATSTASPYVWIVRGAAFTDSRWSANIVW
jgi:mono/diheme cytochrome c family protein